MPALTAPVLVVAVDGPSGSGKSTIAKELARRLCLRYLDTGAMYRAMTVAALRRSVDLADETQVKELLTVELTISTDPDRPRVSIDGDRVTREIRGPAATAAVSAVSAVPEVRAQLVAQQRRLIAASAEHGGMVVEGRDIASVVAPEAAVKVYLTASSAARAERRSRQLADAAADVQATEADLLRRDGLDTARAVSPLRQPDGALVVDSTLLRIDDVVALVLEQCRSAGFATDRRPCQ